MNVPHIKVRDLHLGSHFMVKHICHLPFMYLLMPKIVSDFRFLTVAIVGSQIGSQTCWGMNRVFEVLVS
jgi:hypothetical protein